MENTEIPYKNLSTDYERLWELLIGRNTIIGLTNVESYVNTAKMLINTVENYFELHIGDYTWNSHTFDKKDLIRLCDEFTFQFFDPDIQAKKSATINEQLSESEMKLHWQDQIISAFSKLAGGEKPYEFTFKQVRYQTEELLCVGVCSIHYNKF